MKILNSLIILLFLSCFTKFTFSSVIRIEGPKELKEQFSNNNGDIPASFATFGKVNYGIFSVSFIYLILFRSEKYITIQTTQM